MNKWFTKFAGKASDITGSSWAFLAAVAIILIWAVSGPIFGFSDTWQLIINTLTTLVTFLMVFLIQNTQNRDAKALHLKLDELINAVGPADDKLIDAEDMSDEELRKIRKIYSDIARRNPGGNDGTPKDLAMHATTSPEENGASEKKAPVGTS